MNPIIYNAIQNRCVLSFIYRDHPCVVEPHAYGLSRAENDVFRCYQTGGTSHSGRVPDWKLMRVDRIESSIVTEGHFLGERPGYAKGDRHMPTIFCEL